VRVDPRIDRLRKEAALRRGMIVPGCVAPFALAVVVLAARIGGSAAAGVAAIVVVAALAVLALRAWRGVDAAWLARRLDTDFALMDDSAALLFRDPATLSRVQALQRTRLQTRLDATRIDLRPPWPRVQLLASAVGGLLLIAIALAWRGPGTAVPEASRSGPMRPPVAATRIARSELAFEPPVYTQLPTQTGAALDVKAPQGSAMHWRLRFDPLPKRVALQFHDGTLLALAADGDEWQGTRTLDASTLYRIVLEGAPAPEDDRLYRLDAIADRAPEIRVIQPERTLNLVEAGQKTWYLAFEADDDYGIVQATLSITHAQGNGENIVVKQQATVLVGEPTEAAASSTSLTAASASPPAPSSPARRERDGSGPRTVLRYVHTIDLAALGYSKGDDVIARLVVTDNRAPTPTTTRSTGIILRWPADPSKDSAALEGVVQKTMPAYFRSQRQIIMDSEALLAQRAQLDAAKFLARSDSIGVDQKLLRLRYGQFLGEESEGHAEHAPEGAVGGADTQAGALAGAHEVQEHAAAPAPTKFGEAGDIVAEYGHVHDIAEAATLLDPETKATLKSALAEMWQAELHLRQGHPDEALPYEQRALEFIKQVQQATRIYLARVGLELPQIDEARRLSGEHKDLSDRAGTLAAAPAADAALAELWRGLDDAAPDWDAAAGVLAARGSSPDTLGLLAALDRARREPACADCRAQLRRALWPLLRLPPAASAPRSAADAEGRAYLDALRAVGAAERLR
jgi:hypothetical protein